MKLPIKKKYFDLIKSGKKDVELRDAHLTLICEETEEKITINVIDVWMMDKFDSRLRKYYKEGILNDDKVVVFRLENGGKKCQKQNIQ